MKSLLKLSTILAFLLISLVYEASASDSHIGRVVKVRGEVMRANPSGGQGLVSKGDKLFLGDELVSKGGSYVKVLMNDDSIFQLGPKSKFVFEEFNMRTKNDRTATYRLVKGKLRSLFTKKAPKKTLKIKTPHASMGVRGTEILSDVYNFNGVSKTDIALMSGKLEVTSIGGKSNGKKFNLKPGDIFEMGGALASAAGKAARSLGKPSLKRLPKRLFKRLKKNERKGGDVFLNDAKLKDNPELQQQVDFGDSPETSSTKVKRESSRDLGKHIGLQPDDLAKDEKNPRSGLKRDNSELTPEEKQAKEKREARMKRIQNDRIQGDMRSQKRDQVMKHAQMQQHKLMMEKKKALLLQKQKEKLLQDRINAGLPIPCHLNPHQAHCQPPSNGGGTGDPATGN